jgi:hypothetical protein
VLLFQFVPSGGVVGKVLDPVPIANDELAQSTPGHHFLVHRTKTRREGQSKGKNDDKVELRQCHDGFDRGVAVGSVAKGKTGARVVVGIFETVKEQRWKG